MALGHAGGRRDAAKAVRQPLPLRLDILDALVRAFALVRRGPDSEGTAKWPNAVLGRRRLAILDLSEAGHQPMLSEDGQKAHAVLLRAMAALKGRSDTPDFRLVMVGDGPERERLKALSREPAITDLVIFAGTTADVSVYYSLADVFVLPSRTEGSPNALLEAMRKSVS